MSNSFQQRAADLVAQFQSRSGVSLTKGNEDMLTQMIVAALAGEVQAVSDKVEALVKDLRRDIAKPELGL